MKTLRTLHRKFSEVKGSWSWNSSNFSRPTSMNINELKLNNVVNPSKPHFFGWFIFIITLSPICGKIEDGYGWFVVGFCHIPMIPLRTLDGLSMIYGSN